MMTRQTHFSGSYLQDDVCLLLDVVERHQVVDMKPQAKEQLIQSGQQHYSDMLTLEKAPSPSHQRFYQLALQQGQQRMATEIAQLAMSLHQLLKEKVTANQPLVLVSLVRAGLPIGVLLQRAFLDRQCVYHLPSVHYGISILRGRGIDNLALQYILEKYPKSVIVFVDGWTGKGAIYQELRDSLSSFNVPKSLHFQQIFHQGKDVVPLVTLADPAVVAWLSAGCDDWLMPSSLLNSTIAGLISRTLYTPPEQGFHRCVLYQELQAFDESLRFVDGISQLVKQQDISRLTMLTPQLKPSFNRQQLIVQLSKRFAIDNDNRIKPTIAEATRAILRRDPECVLVNPTRHRETAFLRHLAKQKSVLMFSDIDITPYAAVTIIKKRA